MINNFKLLEPLVQFDNPGDCYFIQFLKRRKDNPDMERDMINVDNLFVYSLDQYRDMEKRIIEISNMHNARAYIRVNRRNTEKLAYQTLAQISQLLINKDHKSVKNAYLSAAGKYQSEPLKRWVVDIDLPPSNFAEANHWGDCVENAIEALHRECNRNSKQGEYKMLLNVPTKNGYHIITNPFNLQKFRQQFPDPIDVHEDNPTILYMPSDRKAFTPVDEELFNHPGIIGL